MILMIAKCTSAITIRNFEKIKFITNPRRYMGCIGLHSEVMGREIIQTWGSAFVKVVSGMPRTLWVYFTMENLQDNSENYFIGR